MVKGTDTLSLAALLVLVAGCSPAVPTPIAPVVITSGQSTLHTLPAGTYVVAWTSDCDPFFLEWAPTPDGAIVAIPIGDQAKGEATVTIPGGQAYLNGGGICETGWTATISQASPGPS